MLLSHVVKVSWSAALYAIAPSLALAQQTTSPQPAIPLASTPKPHDAARKPASTQQVIIAELFTSQGCSSCPPADEVASSLARQQRSDNPATRPAIDQPDHDRPVTFIAWHVDYWDRLGWKDPFSSKFATDRQYADAARRRTQRVYTPQLIVQGSAEFVGSDRNRAKHEVAAAKSAAPRMADVLIRATPPGNLASPQTSPIAPPTDKTPTPPTTNSPTSITPTTRSPNLPELIELSIEILPRDNRAIQSSDLLIVLSESALTTSVPRGENSGRTLINDHVARAWHVVPIADPSALKPVSIKLDLPANLSPTNASVVAFLQDRASGKIIAAAREDLTALLASASHR